MEQFSVTFTFTTLEELVNFKNKMNAQIDKKVDNRGSKTKYLHQKVRDYVQLHKDIKYIDALKIVGEQIKEKAKQE
jgi:hypothetical protein